MDFLKGFNDMMMNTEDIAIATSVDGIPNVRVVNFLYDEERPGVLYFSTRKNSDKVLEFSKNNKVSFTTIPKTLANHIRVVNAEVKKSDLTIYDLSNKFSQKYPGYESIVELAGHTFDIYEIHFEEARVILGFGNIGQVSFR